MTEPPYWLFFLGITLFIVSAFYGIVKARRRNEPVYYWVSGICVLQIIAFAAILLNQFLVFFATMGLSVIVCIGLLPRIMELNREEMVKQKQETDVSAPLRLRDFLTMKGWVKLRATHGFRTTVTLYILTYTGILVAVGLPFIALGLMTPLRAVFYIISLTVVSFLISYRHVWKVLKET
jgi:hypothetical protein